MIAKNKLFKVLKMIDVSQGTCRICRIIRRFSFIMSPEMGRKLLQACHVLGAERALEISSSVLVVARLKYPGLGSGFSLLKVS